MDDQIPVYVGLPCLHLVCRPCKFEFLIDTLTGLNITDTRLADLKIGHGRSSLNAVFQKLPGKSGVSFMWSPKVKAVNV